MATAGNPKSVGICSRTADAEEGMQHRWAVWTRAMGHSRVDVKGSKTCAAGESCIPFRSAAPRPRPHLTLTSTRHHNSPAAVSIRESSGSSSLRMSALPAGMLCSAPAGTAASTAAFSVSRVFVRAPDEPSL